MAGSWLAARARPVWGPQSARQLRASHGETVGLLPVHALDGTRVAQEFLNHFVILRAVDGESRSADAGSQSAFQRWILEHEELEVKTAMSQPDAV
eukprot:821896-Rhodomonas_salina.1